MRLGIIARSDNSGLGNQTQELVNMLQPDKVLLIDSTPFNKHEQFPERYANYNVINNSGFIKDDAVKNFLNEVDVVLSCETFYSNTFIQMAKDMGVKTALQYNYEFLDNLQNPRTPFPDILISPSTWNIDNIATKFSKFTNVCLLRPPTDPSRFQAVKAHNLSQKHNRILHVGGKAAMNDRNGTKIVLEMLKYSKADYELVITSQTKPPRILDSRVTIQYENKKNKEDLYFGFDAMILPRKYGGLCLPMNEALTSGLPVFMSDISPNNAVLPSKWLAPAHHTDSFMARTTIDCFETDPQILAEKVDAYMLGNSMQQEKEEAVSLSNLFDPNQLKQSYLDILFN